MKWTFKYNEDIPDYKDYIYLLNKLEKKANDFFELNNIFKKSFDYEEVLKYEKKKKIAVYEMFDEIMKTFSNLKYISCAIYLNGSYGRNSITANSDLDLTFFFNENDIDKYQTLIYLIRYAISKMFRSNIVHVHSFTKNFTTKYRKENNLMEIDQELETIIEWTKSNNTLVIEYPSNQMITEREICEITSIKCIEDLKELIKETMINENPKEWMYTHECVYKSDESFDVNNLVKELDTIYDEKTIIKKLELIREEIFDLKSKINSYYIKLHNSKSVVLSEYNMTGKRRVFVLINTLFTYLRWYYILNKKDVKSVLDIKEMLNKNDVLIKQLKDNYYYYKYIISRIEIWTIKCNHHFEHRSKEIISKKLLKEEYYDLWNNDYDPIEKQIEVYNKLDNNIENILKKYSID